jgi:parvulin-like peptidyl-prolyl isomerase
MRLFCAHSKLWEKVDGVSGLGYVAGRVMKAATIILAALVAALVGTGCSSGDPRGPMTPIASTPPGGYPIEREVPGGAIAAVPSTEAPVAKPVKGVSLAPVTAPSIGDTPDLNSEPPRAAEAPKKNSLLRNDPVEPPTVPVRPILLDPQSIPPVDPIDGKAAAPSGRNPESQLKMVNAVLAEVNGEVITREDILGPLRASIETWRKEQTPEDFENTCRYQIDLGLRQEISRRLALQEAKANLSEEEKKDIEAQLESSAKNMVSEVGSKPRAEAKLALEGTTLEKEKVRDREWSMIQRFLRQKVSPQIHITHSELLDYYNKVKAERYVLPDRAHVALIMIKKSQSPEPEQARAVAEAVRDRASRGEDFAKLAIRFSHDPMAAKGGDWGMVGRGGFRLKEIDAALFVLRTGEISPIIEGPDAFYILKAIERQEARTVPFTEVQTDLEKELRRQRYDEALQKYIQSLYERSYVRVLYENL